MLNNFKTKEIIFLTFTGVLMFVVDFIISTGIDAATGINGIGYMVSGFIFVALGIIGAYTVKRFGSITILGLIYGVLTTPTNILGPPGAQKILLGLLVGLIADFIVWIFKRKRLGYYLSFTIGNLITLPAWIGILILFGLPGVEEIMSIIWIIVGVYIAQGLVGAWIGLRVYDKIKNKGVIKQFAN